MVKTGTNNPINKEKNEIKTDIDINEENVLPTFTLFKNNLFTGLTINVKIKDINK